MGFGYLLAVRYLQHQLSSVWAGHLMPYVSALKAKNPMEFKTIILTPEALEELKMTGKMTPSAFDKIIEQDIKWLYEIISESDKGGSLEYDHIISTLCYAAKQYRDNGKRIDEINQSK